MDQTLTKLNKKSVFVVAGSTIRYRRSLEYAEKYRIVTKLVFYDEKNTYMEQKFISEKDDFVSAVAYIKAASIKVRPVDILKLHFKRDEDYFQMECPPDLKEWIEFHKSSSSSLKRDLYNFN